MRDIPKEESPPPPSERFDPAASDETVENARDGAKKRRDPDEPVAVVGLGASAGGIGPLQQFFADMPPASGLAFVVVMHLSPEHESNLAAILQQKTLINVTQVIEPVRVKSNCIYVIPPNKQLTFEESMLNLIEPQQAMGKRVTIDIFFRTLARSYGHRAVAIVMSGTDSDGAIGIKHVRAQGGVTIAQDPREAEHESMPLTAISTGMVDWVLPVAKMGPKLMEFVTNERRIKLPPEIADSSEPNAKVRDAPGGETISEETRDEEDESAIAEVLAHLLARTGHDFSHYKRAAVLRRIARRLQVNSLERIPAYLEFLRRHPAEANALLADLLIGVTHFFRDQESFAALEANIPQLFAGKQRDDQVRVWVVGCATGEEAYSLAMLLCEQAERLDSPPGIQVLATDIDDSAIHDARDGVYPSTIEADVSTERLRRFFARDHGRYRVRKELREKVLFASQNILREAPFSRIDLISCRNLLIYLNDKAQNQVFDSFHFALRSGGLLFVGGSEAAGNVNSLFSPLDSKHRIYVRRSVPRPIWQIPLVPLQAAQPHDRTNIGSRSRDLPALSQSDLLGAGSLTAKSAYAGQERRANLFGELHLKLLEQYGPPSLVLNQEHDVVHLSESAGRYLQFGAGEPSAKVLKLVRPELQVELRAALFRAEQERQTVKSPPIALEIDAQKEVVSLHVRPTQMTDPAQGFVLVAFEQQAGTDAPAATPAPTSDAMRDLQEEVHFLKQQLSTTVEKYEAANEELKASNEELQAVNEEMRSATEELETSKEELQSVNEELTTVNHELKSNVEELSRANSDLNTLMASTPVGTIFLNREMRIQRFTPSAQKIFNLLPSDIGRPLTDITHKLRYPELMRDAQRVLDELTTSENEVRLADDGWFLARIVPYRTADDHIAGVVVTFIDITSRKRAEDQLRASEQRLRRSFEIGTVGIIYFQADGVVTNANTAFLRMSGYTASDIESGNVTWQKLTPEEFMPRSLQAMEELKACGFSTPYEKQYVRKDGARAWAVVAATHVEGAEGVKFIIDIGEQKRAEEALRDSEERFRQFAENSADVFWIVDAENRRLEYINPAYERIWGESRAAITRDLNRWAQLLHPDDRDRVKNSLTRIISGRSQTIEYRIIRPNDKQMRWIRDTGFPIRNAKGQIGRVAGVAQDITADKESEAALRQSEERFRLLVEGASDYAIFMVDPSNTIVHWNSGAERIFGWTAAEAIGQSGELVFTPEDRAIEREEKEIEIALRKGKASDCRWHLRKNGTRIWVEGVMARLDDEETGALRGFAKIARDATQQHEAQEELERRVRERTADLTVSNNQLKAEMEHRSRLEQEILLISEREKRRIGQDLHDSLCQELAATAFFLESKAQKLSKKDPAQASLLSDAARTVNDNVGLARDLARGLHPIELSTTGLTNALRELAYRANHANKFACRFVCPKPVRIRDDAVALNLYRIAQEAVTNAAKHARAREIVITLRRVGSALTLQVSDDGAGLASKRTGKGMGIDIMQHRANVIGARLSVEGKKGRGTTLTCTLPGK